MNILIIKTGALGDVVRTSFIAQALRDKYKGKNPKIFWVTQKSALPLFSNNPYIDVILTEEEKYKLKNTEFELIINLEEDKDNAVLVSNLRHGKIIGIDVDEDGKVRYSKESEYWFDMSLISKYGKKKADKLKIKKKKTHRQIIGEMIGVDWKKYEPFLRLTKNQKQIANTFLRRYNLNKSDLIIGINTGAADRWPKSLSIKKTAKLIEDINKKFDAKILLFGGPNEIERNKEILKTTRAPVIYTGCGNDLFEFPALVSVCNLFVTSDSLGLHISLALKRKTICLIGPTSVSEIGMYDFGDKVVSKSKCVCCYKKDCKSMESIDVKNIVSKISSLLEQKITLLITAFREPKIKKAIESALKQKTRYQYQILVSAPDEETLNVAKEYQKKDKRIKIFKDPGKGKSYALNLLFKEIETDILILTDGDVWISENSVEEISNLFLDPGMGCVTGRPIPVEGKKEKYGYWANFLFEAAHTIRKNAFEKGKFIECSGYLFAFRKNKLNQIPLDVAEDTFIPYILWEKGYKIGYAENATVFVKNVDNWKDWIKQKTRTSKAHETLDNYVDTKITPRVKTFKTESKGISWVIKYPKNLKETIWTSELILARLYMWTKVYLDTKVKNKNYSDAWERVESTK